MNPVRTLASAIFVLVGILLAFPGFLVLPALLTEAGFPEIASLGLVAAFVVGLLLVLAGVLIARKLPH